MQPDTQRLTVEDHANLVAYLDDELDPATARTISTKLTQSVTARREVEALQATWELLDFLPRPQAPADFTARTVSEIESQDRRGEHLEGAARYWTARLTRALTCAAAVVLFVALGYVATRWVWPDPTARLARELPLAEHLDEYRAVDSFDFLQQLDGLPEFNAEAH
jgi:anti-sigma factor RsiW